MQKVLQFFARHAEKFALGSTAYFFVMALFADSVAELFAYTWPVLLVGFVASAIIMMKNTLEIQEAEKKTSVLA